MKIQFTILMIGLSLFASAQPMKKSEYNIILGGCFNKDKVSLSINNKSVFTNYIIDNRDSLSKGNLNLSQDVQGIRIN